MTTEFVRAWRSWPGGDMDRRTLCRKCFAKSDFAGLRYGGWSYQAIPHGKCADCGSVCAGDGTCGPNCPEHARDMSDAASSMRERLFWRLKLWKRLLGQKARSVKG